jgi:hypothetical protein
MVMQHLLILVFVSRSNVDARTVGRGSNRARILATVTQTTSALASLPFRRMRISADISPQTCVSRQDAYLRRMRISADIASSSKVGKGITHPADDLPRVILSSIGPFYMCIASSCYCVAICFVCTQSLSLCICETSIVRPKGALDAYE